MADRTSTVQKSSEASARIDQLTSSGASRRGLWASLGAIGAALLASLCCIGPLLFVTIGVGAGLASTFEPVRPLFTVLTIGFLAVGFYVVYGKGAAAGEARKADGTCAVPRSRSRDKVLLWIATVIALVLVTFMEWSKLLV
ncbi:MAG: mercuric transporter MerT family protein [Gemmatimonadaceae bacterium]